VTHPELKRLKVKTLKIVFINPQGLCGLDKTTVHQNLPMPVSIHPCCMGKLLAKFGQNPSATARTRTTLVEKVENSNHFSAWS